MTTKSPSLLHKLLFMDTTQAPLTPPVRSQALFGTDQAARPNGLMGLRLAQETCTSRTLNEYCYEVCCDTAQGKVCNTYCNEPSFS